MVRPVPRPVARPALDVAPHDRVGDDALPGGEVAHDHAVEVRERLAPLHALDDAPAGVLDDVGVLAKRGVVDLADEARVLLLVELARRVREQHHLAHPASFGRADSTTTRAAPAG